MIHHGIPFLSYIILIIHELYSAVSWERAAGLIWFFEPIEILRPFLCLEELFICLAMEEIFHRIYNSKSMSKRYIRYPNLNLSPL